MTQYEDLIRTLSANNKELRQVLEGLQADLRASQRINALIADDLLFAPHWDDLRIPFTQTKLGANLKPDFDTTNVGYLFPQNDATEILYFVAQLPHSWTLGTNLKPHIHWQQSAVTAVTWKVDVKVITRTMAIPAEFTTLTSSGVVNAYVSGNIAQISTFPEIDLSALAETSALILGKVYRQDNTTTGDVLAFELDFHYQSDRPGSRTEFVK